MLNNFTMYGVKTAPKVFGLTLFTYSFPIFKIDGFLYKNCTYITLPLNAHISSKIIIKY